MSPFTNLSNVRDETYPLIPQGVFALCGIQLKNKRQKKKQVNNTRKRTLPT
jgi:hypothetical protein